MTGDTTMSCKVLDVDAEPFAKLQLSRTPLVVITEHYNPVSEYFTVHVDLFMTFVKRSIFGRTKQKTITGYAALYYDPTKGDLRQSVTLEQFSSFGEDLTELLTQELRKHLLAALESHEVTSSTQTKEHLFD